MQITVLALQRKEAYPGELAPEIMSVVDEHTLDENAAWWPAEVARIKATIPDDEVEAWAEIVLNVPTDAIDAALRPSPTVVDATVATP